MVASVPHAWNRVFASALLLLSTILVGTCTDGGDPSGLTGESRLRLSLAPGLLPDLVPDETRPIERIRITAREAAGDALVQRTTVAVDPGASEWTLDFGVPIATGSSLVVTVSVELISVSTGSELVEWSGLTSPINLQVGAQAEVQSISLVKGPLANLAVTGIHIPSPTSPIREGQTLQLEADVSTNDPDNPPTLFWRSLNPGVATVSGTGLVEGVTPGSARITATAGAKADTATVQVVPRPSSVVLTPEGAVVNALGDEIGFEAQVLDPRGDPLSDQGVAWSAGNPGILQHLGGGVFRALARGTTFVTAASQVDPAVSATAEVVVRQVVTAVQMIPEDTLAFIDETVQFHAVALDANENSVEGMAFSWSSSDTNVATVDGQGLALGRVPGTVTIRAEAASPVANVDVGGSQAPTPGVIGVATLQVLSPVSRIQVSPNPFTFRSLEQTRQFTAQAFDAAGNVVPVTDFVWSSSNEGVVTVDPSGLATSVANGSTVIRASFRGVTGTAAVFVAQSIASVEITPSSWTFTCSAAFGGCSDRVFTGRAYDALGNTVPDVVFYWSTSDSCFYIMDPVEGPGATATVTDSCYGDSSPAQLFAEAGGHTGVANIQSQYIGLLTADARFRPEAGNPTPGPSRWFTVQSPAGLQ